MSIVTKTGDRGKTSLFLGGRVSKDDPRVELNGTLDELASFLGMSKSLVRKKTFKNDLEAIQKDLIVICAEVATTVRFLKRLVRRVGQDEVERLENRIDAFESEKKKRRGRFELSGKNLSSSSLNVSRTIARRAERQAFSLVKKGLIKNPHILIYLNRLSDYLFLLAQQAEKRSSFR
jgi:cob(I)alamin adenosyltransferase